MHLALDGWWGESLAAAFRLIVGAADSSQKANLDAAAIDPYAATGALLMLCGMGGSVLWGNICVAPVMGEHR